MQLDVIFDTVCPWCYIGKRRLERALALRPGADVEIKWRPFMLNPDMPPDGIDRTAYLIKKFGSETRVRRVYGAIGEAGHSVEIDFAFDRIRRTPNSVASHRLIRHAARSINVAPLVERLFEAYFIDGVDIGDTDTLTRIGVEFGLDGEQVKRYLESNADVAEIYEENARAHRLGINGVPAFAFESNMVISGAQEPEVLVRVLDAANAGQTSRRELDEAGL
ncbi:MAG: DsbA family oxidoreductase [Rhodospirillales bacterium]|nr:DsbA family oxidoreductase [Rhodospirillales bacterium]MBO6786925.1 DsbA family oxidoreductase [Rhodospirillales bacterium]